MRRKTPIENTQITATFENGQVTGNASCNSYFASYQLDGDKLTIGNAGSTLMACLAPGVMVQEAAYLEALQKAASYQIKAGQLEIADAQAKTILVYSAIPQSAQAPAPQRPCQSKHSPVRPRWRWNRSRMRISAAGSPSRAGRR